MLSLFEGVSSSSGCLGNVVSYECGTPCAFHITILENAYFAYLVYSADFILLLVHCDHGIYSENSEMITCLDSFSKQILSIWVYFDLYQSFRKLPC